MGRRLTVGSLFSGIGGIDLGLERAGMEIRWHSEIDNYASRVLAKHWPGVPNLGDITAIDFRQVEPVDVLAGGFPCQDVSKAGNRAGMGDTRSGLWRDYARSIRDIRPRYVLVENVPGLLSLGMGDVLGDLAALGYYAEWSVLSSCSLGAPHTRERVFVLAHPISERLEGRRDSAIHPCPPLGAKAHPAPEAGGRAIRGEHHARLLRGVDGLPARVDGRRPRVQALGNAVDPRLAELIGGWIIEHARATGYLDDLPEKRSSPEAA